MKGDHVPDNDHVLRYCGASKVGTDNLPMPAAFYPRSGETHLSVNWLEFLDAEARSAAIRQVRECLCNKGFGIGAGAKFVSLEVGAIKEKLDELPNGCSAVTHQPCEDDPSHSGIFGVPAEGAEMLAAAAVVCMLVSPRDVFSARG